jgi:hypothetical protein
MLPRVEHRGAFLARSRRTFARQRVRRPIRPAATGQEERSTLLGCQSAGRSGRVRPLSVGCREGGWRARTRAGPSPIGRQRRDFFSCGGRCSAGARHLGSSHPRVGRATGSRADGPALGGRHRPRAVRSQSGFPVLVDARITRDLRFSSAISPALAISSTGMDRRIPCPLRHRSAVLRGWILETDDAAVFPVGCVRPVRTRPRSAGCEDGAERKQDTGRGGRTLPATSEAGGRALLVTTPRPK